MKELLINHSLLTQIQPYTGPEEATTGRLAIHAGPLILTAIKPSRPGPIVSSLHLATWLAANWHRIRLEARPECPDTDWWQTHCMLEAGHGYNWPKITLWAGEDHMVVSSEATSDMSTTMYASANGGEPIAISRDSFNQAATAFIEETLTNMERAGITGSHLHDLYQDLKLELADPALLAVREAQARRGEDPPYEDEQGTT